jgi:hypothetical protein
MAVVSEPPWLNFASGVAAKNASTSHTIPFGFTSTSGSLLVAIIHGAVTNTASGWAKQAGPVATGECSLFTKTSAGDSSITVTHNGSDYAVNYVIWEFPTGSSLTGIDSTTGSNDTMPALTGLPGTEQVIIGALGRVTVGSETNGSISPSAPWVEDSDRFTAANGTDGTYLAVVRQINVTSTSITPTITPTYSGTWSNGSREKISAALNVAAGATPKSLSDAGAESETVVAAATAALAVAGSETEALTATATAASADAASGAEALTTTAAISLTDTAAAADSIDNGAGTPKALADAATAADGFSITVAAPLADVASAASALTAAAAAALTDAAAAVDSAATSAAAGLTETASVAEALSVAAAATLADVGAGADAGTGSDASNIAKTLADSGAASERLRTTTVRPNTGITARPYAGVTLRP